MGEATPAQAAAGGFVPMLGVGMGSLPGGVNGTVASSRGSSVPQLHSAIVERLRARIELCRRHHSTCENRYQRGQAERSDREHENTLHLLNIVQQGTGTRKSKGSRGSNQQPSDYNRANGEVKAPNAEGEHKISTRIALQGSLRRRLEGQVPGPGPKQSVSCALYGADFKRVRVDRGGGALGLGQGGPCAHGFPQPPQSLPGPSSSSVMADILQRKPFLMPHHHGVDRDTFNATLKEMKQEPCEVPSCGQTSTQMIFDFKEEAGGQIDPELQDLFDELTKTVPSLDDLEFERMLKQDDAFGLDLERPGSAGGAPGLFPPLDKPIKTEYSPEFCHPHAAASSPQLRPASAGPSFATALAQKPGGPAAAGGGPPPGRALPCWPEVSHAEQLKQMAANQQQPNAMLHHPSRPPHQHHHHHLQHHHHHQGAPGGLSSWAPTGAFSQDKAPGLGPLNPQRTSPQSKGINHCLFKANGHSGGSHLDMKVLGTKPTLHFSPKAAPSTPATPLSGMTAALNKTSVQQQQASSAQSHQYQNPQIPAPGAQCLQQKPLPQHGTGLHFKLAQRQALPLGPRLPVNGNLGAVSAQSQSQQRPPVAINQQKSPAKAAGLQRQLNQPHHPVNNDSDKDNPQEQFSRHLTRPPPDYKQARSMVGGQQGPLFTGINASQSMSNGPENSLQSMACHLPHNPSSKMNPLPVDRRFGVVGGACHPSQFQQQNNPPSRVGLNASKPRLQRPGPPGASFPVNGVTSVQPSPRAPLGQQQQQQHSPAGSGRGAGGPPTGANAAWLPAGKQAADAGLGARRLANPPPPQGAKLDMSSHAYQQRHVGPPNQVAPDMGMLPVNPAARGPPSRAHPPAMAPLGNPNQSSPEQRVPAGNFPSRSPSSGSYHSNRANRLTFDFLPEGDNTVPGINADSDFIDSLLKSGSGNDDWMKDINLDEILGSHS